MRANELLNEELITELFGGSDVKWSTVTDFFRHGTFEVNGIKYKFKADKNPGTNNWTISYMYADAASNPYQPNGDQPNDKFKVLSIVVGYVVSLIKEEQPDEISFSGIKEDKLDTLYASMLKNLSKKLAGLGYTAEQERDRFHIYKTETNEGLNETASSGGTSAGAVASVPGGLGAGFDPNADHGVYGENPKKKKGKKTAMIRR